MKLTKSVLRRIINEETVKSTGSSTRKFGIPVRLEPIVVFEGINKA